MLRTATQLFGKRAVITYTSTNQKVSAPISAPLRQKSTYSKISPPPNALPKTNPSVTSSTTPNPTLQSQSTKAAVTPTIPHPTQKVLKVTPLKPPERIQGQQTQVNTTLDPKKNQHSTKQMDAIKTSEFSPKPTPIPQTVAFTTSKLTTSATSSSVPPSASSASSASSKILSTTPTPPIKSFHQQQNQEALNVVSKTPKKSSVRSFFRAVKFVIKLSILSSGVQNLYSIYTTPGARRSMTFWTKAFPIYLDYQQLMTTLKLRQFLTDILIKYDPDNFATRPQSITATAVIVNAQKTDATSQYFKDMAVEVQKDMDRDSDTPQLHSPPSEPTLPPPSFQRAIEIEETENSNRLDRVFADISKIAHDIRDSPQYHSLHKTMSSMIDDPSTIQEQLPLLFQQTKNVGTILPSLKSITYFLKKHTHNLGKSVSHAFEQSDMLSVESKEVIKTNATKFAQFFEKYCIGVPIRTFSPFLKKYALPLDIEAKKDHCDAQYNVLNEKYAKDVYNIIADLRGYYIKIGQLGSLRTELVPEAWQGQLKRFQNDCPYTPLIDLIPLIESQIGPINDHFDYIDPIPLGAASIGQVHKARLKSTYCLETGKILNLGKEVVVKLQYPDVEATFHIDMATIRSFCELAQPEQVPQLQEIERSFLSEFNFQKEAVQLYLSVHDLQDRFPTDLKECLTIPRPIPELCSKHCLTMEYLPGNRLIDFLETMAHKLATQQNMTFDEFMEKHGNQPPPTSEELAQFKHMADWYDYSWNTVFWLYNNTIAPISNVLNRYKKDEGSYPYIHTTLPIDIRSIIDKVYQVHGQQLFFGHHFNSDCHPGNLLWIEDDTTSSAAIASFTTDKTWSNNSLGGTIGLIDYGQVKTLDLFARAMYAFSFIALEEEDWELCALVYTLAGNRTQRNTQEIAVQYTLLGLEYDDDELRQGMNIEQYFEHLNAVDKPVIASDDAFMPSRCTLFLRALPQNLGYIVKTSKHWAPIGRKFLDQHPILRELIQAAVEEIRPLYKQRLNEAKLRAFADFGDESKYDLDLEEFWYATDWLKHISLNYSHQVYPHLFTSPTPFDFNHIPDQLSPQTRLYNDAATQFTHSLSIDQFIPESLVSPQLETSTNSISSNSEYDPNTTDHIKLPPFTSFNAPIAQLSQKPLFVQNLQQHYIPPLLLEKFSV